MAPAQAAEQLTALEGAARRCYRDATRRYLRSLGAEPAETLSAWGHAVEISLAQLAHAHQSLVVPWSKPRTAPMLPSESVPAVLARGMRLAAAVLKWSYLRGAGAPVGVWADLCRLYALAEARACARVPVALSPGLDARSSVEREFLEACMLSVAQADVLRPEQVDVAERAAHFCAAGFALSNGSDPRFAYVIDIEGGDAPAVRGTAALGPSLRSFGMDGAERLLATLVRLVESGRIPPRDFGADIGQDVVLGTLFHLQERWSAPPAPSASPAVSASTPQPAAA
jgi:hypothetical protein